MNCIKKTKLRVAREKAGYTQQQVADYLEVKQASYSRLESGEFRLTVERKHQIAHLFRCDHMELEEKVKRQSQQRLAN